jgi:hypothetical protein
MYQNDRLATLSQKIQKKIGKLHKSDLQNPQIQFVEAENRRKSSKIAEKSPKKNPI